MVLSSFLCSICNTKNMFVKIVHPGGHVKLYDNPVLAGEIMLRNPKFCVAHPNVLQQPWEIVAPETMLMLGEKFYVVPKGTIRKLRRNSPKDIYSCLSSKEMYKRQSSKEKEDHGGSVIKYWFYKIGTRRKHCDNDEKNVYKDFNPRRSIGKDKVENRGNFFRNNGLCGKKNKGIHKRSASFDHWQPSLESIIEE